MDRRSSEVKVLPHSREAEASVLGGILLRNEPLQEVSALLEPADFYLPSHLAIYEAMREVDRRGEPIDPLSLENQLKANGKLDLAGGLEYLTELAGLVPTSENVSHYARIVRHKSQLRQMIKVASDIMGQAYAEPADPEDFFDRAEKALLEVTQAKRTVSYVFAKEIIKRVIDDIQKRGDGAQTGPTGVPTGYSKLDDKTGGFQPGDLVVLAARPSLGKTSLALNIAAHAATQHGIPVLIVSLEMTKEQIIHRMLCAEGHLNVFELRRRKVDDDEWMALTNAASKLFDAPILIDDADVNILQIRNKCRKFRSEPKLQEAFEQTGGLGLVIVDYLQLMHGTTQSRAEKSREREIAEVSRGLKALAKELNMPILALAQLNRAVEARSDKTPKLSDLRESGAIEQDADLVMFIHRPGLEQLTMSEDEDGPVDNSAQIIIAKHRNGPVGLVQLVFLPQYTKFVEPAFEPEPEF